MFIVNNIFIYFVSTLKDALLEQNVNAKVWPPETYLQHLAKDAKKGIAFSDLYDVLAIRVITEKTEDCYLALSTVHALLASNYQ